MYLILQYGSVFVRIIYYHNRNPITVALKLDTMEGIRSLLPMHMAAIKIPVVQPGKRPTSSYIDSRAFPDCYH